MADTEQTLELTDREKAIARGENPDASASATDTEQDTAAALAAGDEANAGMDAPSSAGGTEASSKSQPAAGAQIAASSWIDDEAREVGKSYGLSDEELKQFASADEFRRAGILFDRGLAKKPTADTQVQAAGQQPAAAAASAVADEDIELDPEKYKVAGFDDETVNLVKVTKRLQDRVKGMEPELKIMRDRSADEQRRASAQAFHSTVDNMDEGRFGRSTDKNGRMSPIEKAKDENRRKLHEAAQTIVVGITERAKSAGKQPEFPSMNVLLKRAEALAFADEIVQQAKKEVTDSVKSQSSRRRPVGSVRTASHPAAKKADAGSADDVVQRAMTDKRLKDFYDKAQQDNGAA